MHAFVEERGTRRKVKVKVKVKVTVWLGMVWLGKVKRAKRSATIQGVKAAKAHG